MDIPALTTLPIDPVLRAAWQVPAFSTSLYLGRRHPWCVVIPVVNEGGRIRSLLARMAALDITGIADIVIVDGGSTDGSLALDVLQGLGVCGLLVKTGPGKLSGQLRCAYAFALDQGYAGIVTIDGNDKDDPEAIPRFVDALKDGVDFVQASRFIAGGIAKNTPKLRDFAIRYIHAPMLSMASGFRWTDTTQGFRAYSRRLLLDPRVAPFRDVFMSYELLAYLSYRAPKLGFRCIELPTIRRYPQGEVPTKIGGFKGNLSLLRVLLRACAGRYDAHGEPGDKHLGTFRMADSLMVEGAQQSPTEITAPLWQAAVILLAVVLGAYGPVLSSNFGTGDDYTFLLYGMDGSQQTSVDLVSAGRPLNAVLLGFGFHASGSVENLTHLREITLLGIWLLGCGVFQFARTQKAGFLQALAMASGIVLLPSFQVYAAWSQHFTTPYAGALGLFGAYSLTPACLLRDRSRALAVGVAAIALLGALLIYQPIAMFFCVGVLVSILFQAGSEDAWDQKRMLDTLLAFFLAMVLGFVIFKVGQHYFQQDFTRYGLVRDIPGKLHWFVAEPLRNAFSLYFLPPVNAVALVVALIVVAGIGDLSRRLRRGDVPVALMVAYILCGVIGCYLPNLVTAENWASYRSIAPLGAAVVVLLVYALPAIDGLCVRRPCSSFVQGVLGDRALRTVSIALLVALTLNAQGGVLRGFVLPNTVELDNVSSLLTEERHRLAELPVINIRKASWMDSAARLVRYDEFGLPSSVAEYPARSMVEIVRRSIGLEPNAAWWSPPTPVPEGWPPDVAVFDIDFRRLVTSQRFRSNPGVNPLP